MVYKWLVESLGQGCISDVCREYRHTELYGQFRPGNYGAIGIPSCVGPIPPVVITKSYFCTIRLLASMLRCLLLSKWKRRGSAERTFRPLRPVSPQYASCHAHPVSERG